MKLLTAEMCNYGDVRLSCLLPYNFIQVTHRTRNRVISYASSLLIDQIEVGILEFNKEKEGAG